MPCASAGSPLIRNDIPDLGEKWLDLDRAAVVEVTSEEKDFPIESALVAGKTTGWRAADSGTQTIRLIFDEPQRLNHIRSGIRGDGDVSVLKSSSCAGLQMADARFERLCDNSGISVPRTQSARPRNIRLTSRMSAFLNWSLSRTSVEESARASLKSLRLS